MTSTKTRDRTGMDWLALAGAAVLFFTVLAATLRIATWSLTSMSRWLPADLLSLCAMVVGLCLWFASATVRHSLRRRCGLDASCFLPPGITVLTVILSAVVVSSVHTANTGRAFVAGMVLFWQCIVVCSLCAAMRRTMATWLIVVSVGLSVSALVSGARSLLPLWMA
jgi:hypothetical protein